VVFSIILVAPFILSLNLYFNILVFTVFGLEIFNSEKCKRFFDFPLLYLPLPNKTFLHKI